MIKNLLAPVQLSNQNSKSAPNLTALEQNSLSPPLAGVTSPKSLNPSPVRSRDDTNSPAPDIVNRPSFLPPKSAAELQKHKKEYEEIAKQIKKSMEKEAKEKAKRDQANSEREKKMPEYRKIWAEEIIPNWEKKRGTKKVAEMWWAGLPPAVRGQVWRLCIGNDLRVTQELYDISLAHAKETKRAMLGSSQDDAISKDTASPAAVEMLLGKEATVALVALDEVPKHFPARPLFSPEGPMYESLISVLEAYASYRPDVGYVPGMSFLVAVLLLNVEVLDAFVSLTNLINRPFLLSFYITDRHAIYKYTKTADIITKALLPKVHKHFHELEIAPEHYLIDWFMTIFSKVLPLEVATRVWDVYFLEGEIFLFKVALALLKIYSHQFETYTRDLCIQYLNHFPEDLTVDALFDAIGYFSLDPKKFQRIMDNATEM